MLPPYSLSVEYHSFFEDKTTVGSVFAVLYDGEALFCCCVKRMAFNDAVLDLACFCLLADSKYVGMDGKNRARLVDRIHPCQRRVNKAVQGHEFQNATNRAGRVESTETDQFA